MTSTIAWLDTSAEEQRRVREMIELFSQRESRDELGVGQIRDVFSDALFPGTSVIQTRARYFLIVPWVFTHAARRGRSGAELLLHANRTERSLVEMLRSAGVVQGLIGRRAGAAVKILPSSIYWSGLRTYGILTRDIGTDRLGALRPGASDDDELAARVIGDWYPTLPAAPEGFPQTLPNGLDLTDAEAQWLRERMLATTRGSLLAHLLTDASAPDEDSPAPWADSVAMSAPADARTVLRHAEMFSLVMHGAAILYNLLVAERYEAAGYTRVMEPVDRFRAAYTDWLSDLDDEAAALQTWDRNEFATFVSANNHRAGPAQAFAAAWADRVLDGSAGTGRDSPPLRELVASRERDIKRVQSRLTNEKLLGAWSGDSGSGRMTFRWRQVRDIVTDIHQGTTTDAGT